MIIFAIVFSTNIKAYDFEEGHCFAVAYNGVESDTDSLYFKVLTIPSDIAENQQNGTCRLITKKQYLQDVYWYLSEEELGDIKDYSGIIRIPNIVADEESNGDNEFIVNEISEDAFLNSSVTSVEIPENVKNIKPLTFTSCGTLQSITVSEDNKYYSNGEDGALYNKTMTELIQIPGGLTNFEIMACVEDINNKALCSCKNLKNIIGVR